MPIRDEAINVFLNQPGDGDEPRLELTYNFGVDHYELGTGLRPHRDQHRRPRRDPATLSPSRGSSPNGRRTRSATGGSRICFVRDPDGYRIELVEREPA